MTTPDIEKLRGLLSTFQHLADNCLARHAANPKYADEILHTAKTYEEMRELCSEGVELLADYERLLRERYEHRTLAAEMYQVCGVLNAPARVLDQLSAIAAGKPAPFATLLPFIEAEQPPAFSEENNVP